MSLTSEILSKPISLDAIRSLLASEAGYVRARFILEQIVSRDGLFGVTVAEASRLLDLLDAREGKADTSSSTILNIINQQADGAPIEESMNVLGERGIGFDELLAYLEGEILSEPDRALRQKKAYLGSMLGLKVAVAEMKPNADFAKLDDGLVVAPALGKDSGAAFVKNTDGNRVRPIFLDDGEFVISRDAVEGFGFEAGASEEEAHHKGIELLREMQGSAYIYENPISADLIVLSACNTGVGQTVSGDDFLGLARSLYIGGASTVLNSLWPISDANTAQFMKYFHQSAQNGNVARAWLTARNKLRDSGVKPADYGAFVLGGAANINAY